MSPSIPKHLVTNSIKNIFANAFRVSCSLITTWIAATGLTQISFGYVNMILGYTMFLNYILGLGFEHSSAHHINKNRALGKPENNFTILLYSCIAFFLSSTLALVALKVIPITFLPKHLLHLEPAILFAVLQCIVWSHSGVLAGFMRAHNIFSPNIFRENILFPVCFSGILYMLLHMKGLTNEKTYMLAYFLASLAGYLYIVFHFFKHFSFMFPSKSYKILPKDLFECIRWSLPIGVFSVLDASLPWIAIVAIGHYFSPATAATFSVNLKLANLATLSLLASIPILSPTISRHFHEKEETQFSSFSNAVFLLSILISGVAGIFLGLFSKEFLGFLGKSYQPSFLLLICLLPGFVIEGGLGISKAFLTMCESNRLNILNSGTQIALVIVGLHWAQHFAESWVIGIVISISYVATNLIRLFQINKLSHLHLQNKAIATSSLLSFALVGTLPWISLHMELSLFARALLFILLSGVALIVIRQHLGKLSLLRS